MGVLSYAKKQMSRMSSAAELAIPKTLTDVLKDKELRQLFRQFLYERMAIESLLFYESIEMYEKIKKARWRQRAGESLINKFVFEKAQYEVNLPGAVRNALLETKSFDEKTFEQAKDEVYTLMQSNFFESFLGNLTGEQESRPPSVSFDGAYARGPYYDKNPRASAERKSAKHRFLSNRVSQARKLSVWEAYFNEETEENEEVPLDEV